MIDANASTGEKVLANAQLQPAWKSSGALDDCIQQSLRQQ